MPLTEYLDRVTCGDCLDVLRELPDGCAALAIVDGPYNMRKADWDKFDSWQAFAEWYLPLWEQLSRVLRDNCSLYVFGTFEGLAALKPGLDSLGGGWAYRQTCTWDKGLGAIAGRAGDTLRMYPQRTEFCIFYARERVDISALAWDGVTREDNTIRAYLNAERERAGVTVREVAEAFQKVTGSRTVTGMASHWFGNSQWACPTAENYQWLRDLFNVRGNGSGPYLMRPWDDLRREYEDLRREYEDLRYPFNPEQGTTDVWDAPICAGAERIKDANGQTAHAAQKPLSIMRRIVRASSNEGDTVLVPFSGVGSAEVAAAQEGRHFIGIEIDDGYCSIANERIADALRNRQPTLELEPAE
jgi:adenine-specific DNA-methyltransferase